MCSASARNGSQNRSLGAPATHPRWFGQRFDSVHVIFFVCARAPPVDGSASAMLTCCVPGCTSGYRGNKTPRHFFSPPSHPGLRAAWDHAIPRLDHSLSSKSRVCDVRFYPDDIAKTYTHFIKDDSLREAIDVLSPIQQESFRSSLKQAKVKDPQGMRYSTTWLMNCLLLRIASPKAYKLIRAMNLLALPTCSRLNQLIAGVPCQYGFNKVALETIKTYFQNNPEKWNHGTILIDEIKLCQSVEFNPSTYKFDGFVAFAGTAPGENGKLADHAL
ncbi:hypothetical protein HPB51_026585 [Rhipicephalus microplus]|uniref:THAP-type domain-containing protein n=1 Tax=Rhipicephalus microplus TaxID=6941 RepID=A0A9J6D2Q0_RHIMP|nr:hypothetical protein HPB51_026585 [Rhipicephalus microplus]